MSRRKATRRGFPPGTTLLSTGTVLRRVAPLFFLALAGLFFLQGGWIYGKAIVAQVLIGRSWETARVGTPASPPWPWADTHPVARLLVPRLDEEILVLAGSSGRTLAFGPGHVVGTPLPGDAGNSVVGGHRDTHFSFLRNLEVGDELIVEGASGEKTVYRVRDLRVVDHRDTGPLAPSDENRLTLITCYPFDALVPGGPLRWVVTSVSSKPS